MVFGGAVVCSVTENQVASFGGGQGEGDGFRVAHLTDQNHVRVFSQGGTQGVGKAVGVLMQLALVNERLFALVDELNRVFDGQNVGRLGFVDVVDHRRQRGGFTRTGRAGYQDQTAWIFGNFLENARRTQFFQRQNGARNGTEYGGRAAFGHKGVDAETGNIRQLK